MSGFAIVIIVLALGIIIGNILLLKHSAKQKLPTPKSPPKTFADEEED